MIAPPEGHAWASGTGWAWRPGLAPAPSPLWPAMAHADGAAVSADVKAFQDGDGALVPVPGGVALWATGGAYLSLTVDLPARGIATLSSRHVVTLAGRAALSAERAVFARLNLKQGPNTTPQTRPATLSAGGLLAEFDLAYMDLGPARIAHGWVDLIVERPAGALLCVTDLALAHRPRLEP